MPAATRPRASKPTIVYYQHIAGGTVHSYDKEFLDAAFASLALPAHLKQKQKKKHPLEEIAIQIRKRVLVPCAAPAEVNTVTLDPEFIDEVLAKERELTRERKLAAIEDAKARLEAGEDVDLTPYLDASPYAPAAPAQLVPDRAEREPGVAAGIVEDVVAGFVPDDGAIGEEPPPGSEYEDDAPFGDVELTDVVSPDRPRAAEPAGGTTTRRPRGGKR